MDLKLEARSQIIYLFDYIFVGVDMFSYHLISHVN